MFSHELSGTYHSITTLKSGYMKLLIFLFFILLAYDAPAQKSNFVRVYDLKGHKTNKGEILTTTDTSLILQSGAKTVTIPLARIGTIKTKRSAGNNILVGSIIGTVVWATLGVASSDPDQFLGFSAGEGAALGAIVGAPMGAAIGGITILFKHSKTYSINADATKWKAFQSAVTSNK
jgi:hypothetical protein